MMMVARSVTTPIVSKSPMVPVFASRLSSIAASFLRLAMNPAPDARQYRHPQRNEADTLRVAHAFGPDCGKGRKHQSRHADRDQAQDHHICELPGHQE